VVTTEQPTIDRQIPLNRQGTEERAAAERAARESLRAQVAKLERELSGLVARGFPHISLTGAGGSSSPEGVGMDMSMALGAGPRLLSLAELERARDRLVVCLRRTQEQAQERAELELRSRDLLERMRLEPGRYKFVRLRVTDLGEQGCGVWEVRPRLGLIGMLAGWWQLKLSSGCPLPRPRAHGARPALTTPRAASGVEYGLAPVRGSVSHARRAAPPWSTVCHERCAAPTRDRTPHRLGFEPGGAGGLQIPAREVRSPTERGDGALLAAHRGERVALAVGQRADRLGFRHLQLCEQLAAAALAPAALAH
jgi:hypothetical protein